MANFLRTAAFAAGLAIAAPQWANATFINFEGLPSYPSIITQANQPYAGDGVTFSFDHYTAVDDDTKGTGNHALNFDTLVVVTTSFNFAMLQFDYLDTVRVTVLSTGFSRTLTGNGVTYSNSGLLDFSAGPVDTVTISGSTFIDNLDMTPVTAPPTLPEPASFALVALALGGATFASRRRQA